MSVFSENRDMVCGAVSVAAFVMSVACVAVMMLGAVAAPIFSALFAGIVLSVLAGLLLLTLILPGFRVAAQGHNRYR